MTDVVIRPLRAGEEQLFLSMPDPAPIGHRANFDYAPQHAWVALQGDQVIARAAWAAMDDDPTPVGLDWFDLEGDPELGARLLNAAQATLRDRYGRVPEYHLFLKPGWRERPEEVAAVELRLAAARLAGLEVKGERIRTVWTAVNPLPEPPGRYEVGPADPGLIDEFGPPDILTGVEGAFADGVNLAENPLFGLGDPQAYCAGDQGLAVVGWHGDTRFIGYLAVREDDVLLDLLIGVTSQLEQEGAVEIYADTDSGREVVLAALAAADYRQVRSRLYLTPAG
ncbi:MAG TPA: acetyltransferase [Micromonosporaceae bacterium]|nr:acetyltransferase [Micromonosporaceae bacterium]HCU48954.1 acetyltransferase [Micromonosporaceae bacterium]